MHDLLVQSQDKVMGGITNVMLRFDLQSFLIYVDIHCLANQVKGCDI